MGQQFDYTFAARMGRLEPSPFYIIQSAAAEIERNGIEVLYLSIGEPDFDTPHRIKNAAVEAIVRGDTKYTASDGTKQLKKAIQLKFSRDNGLSYADNEITVTMGGVQAIFNTFMATVSAGDEVILPAPYFSPYASAISLSGATAVLLKTQERHGFIPQPEEIEALITSRTRWLVLNSPSNPSGAVISSEMLQEIAEVVRRHPRLLVFSDDMYETIRFDDRPFANIVNAVPDFRGRTVILNGVSKAYAMTGWRMAYLAGPKELISGISQVSATSAFAPNSISQAAAVEALSGPQEKTRAQSDAYEKRRDILLAGLSKIAGLTFTRPAGAFFVLVNCQQFFGKRTAAGRIIENDVDFVLHCLRSESVAFMPGSGFGMPGYFRISFAASEPVLYEALKRIQNICSDLRS
ncbi:pyridoxal phosphate-dependent aminotransferase [Caballeronia sp. 15715]|uniref:pyridoxal phosphate-dependent aminotransferase n=1 Tax=unclassified Caballeronia TaxID=2646786 RepID=UPI0039E462A3